MIDRSVEHLVREIFNAIIVEDEDRFQRALAAVPDNKAQAAYNLATAIDRTILEDLDDVPLSEDRLEYLVHGYYEMENWYKHGDLPVRDFLSALSGLSSHPVAPEAAGLLAFLLGGWLLTAFLESGDLWYEYLDDILNRLDI